MKYVWFFMLILSVESVQCQLSFRDIDFNRLRQKKIKSYVQKIEKDKQFISELKPSCHLNSVNSGLHSMQNKYLVKETPEKVWKAYDNANLAQIWNGKMVSFGFLCSKWSDYVVYTNDPDGSPIDTGQVFFINLKLLCGLYNLPVGVQIVEIDEENRSVTFSYLEGGKSAGRQIIQIFPTHDGYTCISHITEFRSASSFRDRHLYPHFHTKVLNEFHKNVLGTLKTDHLKIEILAATTHFGTI